MGQAEQSTEHMYSLAKLKQVMDWEKCRALSKPYKICMHCLEWSAGKVSAEVEMLVEANNKPHDIVIYMDSSVTRHWFS